ncbi:MAG: ABC transporter permease, partial [Zoogloeaceae bacterium]|nr:ABC transporter permease [Zoogloeaceae bacterium]
MLIQLLALWKKEGLALIRDRHGLAALFIMPAAFILIMSLTLADALPEKQEATIAYAVLDLDNTPASRALDALLGNIELLKKSTPPSDEADARLRVRAEEMAFVVVIPEGFARQIDTNQTPVLRFLIDPAVPGMVRSSFHQYVEMAASKVWLTQALEQFGQNMMLPELREVTERVGLPEIAIESVSSHDDGTVAAAVPSSVQQNVPAWLIFSMF